MTRYAAFFGLMIAALVSTTAHAETSFNILEEICVPANGDIDQALKIAEKLGWKRASSAAVENRWHDPTAKRSEVRFYPGFELVLADSYRPHTHTRSCGVQANPREIGLPRQLAAFAGVPLQQLGGKSAYIWREEDGRHIPIAIGSAEYKAAITFGEVKMLMEVDSSDNSLIMLGSTTSWSQP